ncbi:SgcJ/EcaC family oxidoreductase [Streptomyces sp. ST2-7A]|uniref:SgcJ/EcaC family oxidoreductase n=1 Tax=Streptomyces sp. ST2-7A TaxID=2907214 RepID=UPI001F222D3E|nr:SgcJ/EcaC family oxidoreductase [Streptomyces sp. ST2-7A]MCE7079479.1 SgcJ/EcaC family oxidoreductase [Streptomyces sp. ST2-7A]
MSERNTHDDVRIPDEDRAAVTELPRRVMAAWADHDAETFSEIFAETGTMILPGVHLKGREAIKTFLTEAFAGPYKGTRVTGTPIDVRFFTPVSGLFITRGGVLAPGEEEPSRERAVHACWVVVKEGGEWRLASYQNSPRHTA